MATPSLGNLILSRTAPAVGLSGSHLLSGSSAIVNCGIIGTLASVFSADSTSTVTIGSTGTKTFTIPAQMSYLKGTRVRATAVDVSDVWMEGIVSSYVGTTLVMVADRSFGTGSYSNWNIALTGRAQQWPLYGNTIFNGKLVENHTANSTTFTLKTLAGDDPTSISPVTMLLPTGQLIKIQGRVTLMIYSGATLGIAANAAFRLWFLLAYDAGFNVHLVVVQTRSSANEIRSFPHAHVTTVLMGTGADSAGVFYSDLVMTDAPFVVLGYAEYDSGLAVPGEWVVSPDRFMLHAAGAALPGDTVQQSYFSTGAQAQTTNETFPVDNSIPQITEGLQFMSCDITPLCKANVLEISARGNWQTNYTHDIIAALFKVGVSDALDAKLTGPGNVSYHLYHEQDLYTRVLANAVTSQTYTVRGGSNNPAVQIIFNGNLNTSFFGLTFNSYIAISELMT